MAKEVEAVSGRDVRLEMEVCSDPIPSKTTWDWGSLRVEAGQVKICQNIQYTRLHKFNHTSSCLVNKPP